MPATTPAAARPPRSAALLKGATLLLVMLPGLLLAADFARDALSAKPITQIIHTTGDWAIRLLFVSLLITPLRQALQAHSLISIRRIIGVAAFSYAAIHLVGYAADEMFDLAKVASEIVKRIYLTIGFTGLVLLAILAATSTDAMVRRLGGKRWKRLHRAAYLIGVIAVVHFFMQSKLDVTEPTLMAGLFAWLMLYRLAEKFVGRAAIVSLWALVALAVASALFTAAGEWTYFAVFTAVDPNLVLRANLTTMAGLRPAWAVLLIALAVPLAVAIRRLIGLARSRASATA